MASEVLSAKNISKVGTLVKIVLDGTKTDITMELVSEYIDDVVTIKTDRIKIGILPGEGRYGPSPMGRDLSYYFHDEEETKDVVKELFKTDSKDDVSGDNDLIETNGTLVQDEKIRLEVLNAGNNMTVLNNVVEKLNEGEFDVVKIGNYPTIKNEPSRIIDYGTGTEEELEELKKALNIKTVETSDDVTTVKYSVIIGTNYKQ